MTKTIAKSRAEQSLFVQPHYDMFLSLFAGKKQSVMQDPQLWASATGVKTRLGWGVEVWPLYCERTKNDPRNCLKKEVALDFL